MQKLKISKKHDQGKPVIEMELPKMEEGWRETFTGIYDDEAERDKIFTRMVKALRSVEVKVEDGEEEIEGVEGYVVVSVSDTVDLTQYIQLLTNAENYDND